VELTAADDDFHAPAEDDPLWTETAWFGFAVPERRLAGAIYPVFRTNQGVCSSGVYVWDDTAEAQHEVLYARNSWHLPMPGHLTTLELANGLRYDVREALQRYGVRYADGDELVLDLEFDALHEPHAPLLGATGHLDQLGRVTGTMVLHGEEIAVDCFEMRDRSWSVRRDHGAVRAAYDYAAAGPDTGFLAMSIGAGDQFPILAGFHLHDGKAVRLTGGTRQIIHETDPRPVQVRVEASDEAGCQIEAVGTCVNRFAFQSSPNYFAWMSLTRWVLDGVPAWGEDQDVWSPDLLRRASRERGAE
jgi:hypothetical protein